MSGRLKGWIVDLGGCTRMSGKVGLRQRLRYWFDNTMSKGTISLIGWLALVTFGLVVTVSLALTAVEPAPAPGEPQIGPLQVLWKTFVSAFALAVPDDGPKV